MERNEPVLATAVQLMSFYSTGCAAFLALYFLICLTETEKRAKVRVTEMLNNSSTEEDARFEKDFRDPPMPMLLVSAMLSHMAYLNPQEAKRVMTQGDLDTSEGEEDWGFLKDSIQPCGEGVRFFDARAHGESFHCTQAYCVVCSRSRIAYLSFRGTQERRDVLANLDLRTKRFWGREGVLVHNGFRSQFNAVEPMVTGYLDRHRDRYDCIVCTGHSLGGALATLASVFYSDYMGGSVPVMCHTFGSPRVGNAALSDNLKRSECMRNCAMRQMFTPVLTDDEREHTRDLMSLTMNAMPSGMSVHWRVFNTGDPVPMLPMSHRFVHLRDRALCLTGRKDKPLLMGSSVDEDVEWYARPAAFLSSVNLFRLSQDHDMKLYVSRLRKCKNLVSSGFPLRALIIKH